MKIFGFQFPFTKEQEREEEAKKSFAPPQFDDGAINIENARGIGGSQFQGQFVDLDGSYKNDSDLIVRYRSMSIHPEIDTAIEEITNEAIVTDEVENPVKLILDNVDYSDSTKTKIHTEFDNILGLLEFRTKGYDYFRRWYIDARCYFHTIIDETDPGAGIKEIRYIDPLNMKKVREIERKQDIKTGVEVVTVKNEFYVYNRTITDTSNPQVNRGTGISISGVKISPDVIVYVTSGLYDPQKKLVYGYLHKAIRTLNQLKMMEDAVVIYRLARAPERRAFYVDVGNLPKPKAEQYMKELINRYRNKLNYDANTGEIRDDRRYLSVLEDYWLPRREGSKGTEITTLPGASNIGQIEDINYFLRKLSKALNIPYSRVENEQKSFQIGRSVEISRDEIKFAKFIERLRTKFSELFYQLLKKQLILKGIIAEEDWEDFKKKVHFHFSQDMYFSELKELEVETERLNALMMIEPFIGTFYSKTWVRKNVLRQNDHDIEIMDLEIKEEGIKDEQEQIEQEERDDMFGGGNDFGGPPSNPFDQNQEEPYDGYQEEDPNIKPQIKPEFAPPINKQGNKRGNFPRL